MSEKNKKILIVDDSLMIRRIVGMILKEYDYDVMTAENGLIGCEMAKANMPDLIIMDVTMPVMNGIEAAAKIKANAETAHIPVLIFTSLGSEHDIQAAQAAGVAGFLNKPIAKDELKSAVFALLSPGSDT